MAPPKKTITKPKRIVRINPSRAAGAPARASAAATEPMRGAYQSPSFYDPDDNGAGTAPAQSGLGRAFTGTVTDSHVPLEHGGSADVEVLEHMAAEVVDNRDQLAADIARIRQFRKPIGAMSQKLALPVRPGYHRHWFNDVAGRISEAEANGWAFVKGSDNKPLSRCVGTGRDKGAQYAFAMELPLVFWQEDQDAKNKLASEKLSSLKSSPFRAEAGAAKPSDKGKFYDPHEESGAGPIQIVKS